MKKLIEYTNTRIASFYITVKNEYSIIGSGKARFENNKIIVDYVEDGVKQTWSMDYFPEYLKTMTKDYVFNCWSELA